MEEKEKGKSKLIRIVAITLIVAALLFAVITAGVLNNINKKYDDLKNKNDNLPKSSQTIVIKNF